MTSQPAKTFVGLLLTLGLCFNVAMAEERAQVDLGRWNEANLSQIITTAGEIVTPGERIVALSSHFVGTPYIAGSLIGGPQTAEQLVVNLAGFDCFTFLDVIEALRRASNLVDFPEQIKQVRYRDGRVDYASRRHFFSDWVAEKKPLMSDVTTAVGQGRAQMVVKQLNNKTDGSPWLKGLPVVRREISYIPTNKIDASVLAALQTGDYVGIFSQQAGLDVSHTGLLVKDNDRLLLRHASSLESVRRVVDVDLLEYLQRKPGLVVYRAR